jgi:hypothetical protein
MVVAMAAAMLAVRIITDPITEGVIPGPSPWRWVIGLTTFTEVVIIKAALITSGNQDIGQRGMGSESGSMAITSSEADTDRAAKERRLTAAVGDLEIALP